MGIAKVLGFDLCPRLRDLAERKLFLPRPFLIPDARSTAAGSRPSVASVPTSCGRSQVLTRCSRTSSLPRIPARCTTSSSRYAAAACASRTTGCGASGRPTSGISTSAARCASESIDMRSHCFKATAALLTPRSGTCDEAMIPCLVGGSLRQAAPLPLMKENGGHDAAKLAPRPPKVRKHGPAEGVIKPPLSTAWYVALEPAGIQCPRCAW